MAPQGGAGAALAEGYFPVTRLMGNLFRRRPPTDREILDVIYKHYEQKFADFVKGQNDSRKTKVYVPIDVKAIAAKLGTDGDIVFGRLYYYLEKKHSFKNAEGATVHFFAFDEIPGERHCIQFPLMASVLADLTEEHRRFLIDTWIAIGAFIVSIFALGISIGEWLASAAVLTMGG